MKSDTTKSFAPSWARDAIFYQIFPERFANGDPSNDPAGVVPWGGKPESNNYFGGDLQGIIEHLDYIADLGANAIYLNPIFASSSNHKYYTSDYLKVDPAFGTNALFKKLIDLCHQKGIRVVIDGVFNHTGVDHWAFQDIIKNGEKSKYLGWYNVYSFPVQIPPHRPNYECWWNYGRLPKLMVQNPEVKAHLFEVTKYWTEMGIDGWRLDVPNEIPHEFWIEWRPFVKSLNSDCYIVGEIWGNATAWLQGDQFDAVMNYQFRKSCLDFFCSETISSTEFDKSLTATRSLYPEEANYALQNLIGSHDTERFLTLCDGEIWRLKLATLFQMTYLGAPMVYYGDEIGIEGGKDPDCRRTMVWDEEKWNKELRGFFKKLIQIRKQTPALRRGDLASVLTDDIKKVFIYKRNHENEEAYVILNLGVDTVSIDFPVTNGLRQYSEILDNSTVKVREGRMFCELAGHSGKIIVGSV